MQRHDRVRRRHARQQQVPLAVVHYVERHARLPARAHQVVQVPAVPYGEEAVVVPGPGGLAAALVGVRELVQPDAGHDNPHGAAL